MTGEPYTSTSRDMAAGELTGFQHCADKGRKAAQPKGNRPTPSGYQIPPRSRQHGGTMPDTSNLLPCPFCDGLPRLDRKAEDYGYYPAAYKVLCTLCGASVPYRDEGCETATDPRSGMQRAIDAWNTRAQPILSPEDTCIK